MVIEDANLYRRNNLSLYLSKSNLPREEDMTATQARLSATGARITAIARSTETVSLDLLRAIDGTVDALNGLVKVVDGFADLCSSITADANSAEVVEGEYLDEDDQAIDALSRTSIDLKDYLSVLVRKRGSIDHDPRLCDHHCDALHDAYEAAELAVAELIESAQIARAAIIAHDLKAEPRGGPEIFATVNALIANLHGE